MEKDNVSIGKEALKYGAIIAAALILLSLVAYVSNLSGNRFLGWLENIIIIGGLVWAMKNFRDKHRGGYMEFGQGVSLGTLVSLFGGSLTSLYSFIFLKYIDPSALEGLKNASIERMMQGGYSDAELEMMDSLFQFFYTPGMMLIGGILGAILGGVIISLILAAIIKKPKPLFEEATQE